MAIEKEAVFEFNTMVVEHIKALWIVGGGLAFLDINIIAYVARMRKTRIKGPIKLLLFGSLGSAAVSLVAGYTAEAVIINAVKDFARGLEWIPEPLAEFCVFVQMLSIAIGIGVFIWASILFWSVIAEYIEKHGITPGEGG